MKAGDVRPYAFVLAVRDMDATAAYFRDALGFDVNWAEADDWRLLSRGQVRVMIGNCPGVTPAQEIGDHSYFGYLEVDDIHALHAELSRRGAIIRQPPADKPWGQREMLIATPDGHRMMVGQTLASAATA
ncbi:MAG: VOC family protein [Acidisphaera sp.]|nr:VOC family protein [Acidisphaera sp.]